VACWGAVVMPVQVAADDLAQVVGALKRLPNLGSIVVTVPHKETIAPLCNQLTETARLVGAVNVTRREPDGTLTGGQFDGEGFVAGLRAAGHEVRGARIWMAGAGGAAAGIGYAVLRHGAAALTVHNRTTARAQALVDRLAAGLEIVVNATSLGLKPGDALPVDPSQLEACMLAAEVVMQPEVTPFLREAAARGCRTHGGLAMLVEQVAILCDFVAPAGSWS